MPQYMCANLPLTPASQAATCALPSRAADALA
ncbi:hypothetical protein GBAR_LOCUS2569 [Geodia barretti]|uniref:Uncharacterized protein n=2 Tax=Geodia barretti TaxID=519541 RepID=A0AA35QZZ6_GEOBA|nr:hypothetical protein GBAR_LOCUS2569 [Geodia barretti]